MTGATIYKSLLYVLTTAVITSVIEGLLDEFRGKRGSRLNRAERKESRSSGVAQFVQLAVIFALFFPFVTFGLMWLTTENPTK